MLESNETSLTERKVKQFLRGELTWAQLMGVCTDQAVAIAELGYMLFRQGKFDSAQKIFEGLACMNPREGYFHAMLGAIFARQEKMEDAIHSLNTAVQLGFKDPQVFLNRAEIQLSKGLFLEAQMDLRAAIACDPDQDSAVVRRAKTMAATTARLIAEIMRKGDNTPFSK